MKVDNPLVSVIIVTYNSSKYVLETLESAKKQTYQNIELIISDDGSMDDTVDLCQNWIDTNKARFVSTKIVTAKNNQGIPANCNKGVKASSGEWLKLMAGDDLLDDNCITKNMLFVKSQGFLPMVVISKMIQFVSEEENPQNGCVVVPTNLDILNESASLADQHKYLLQFYFGNTPSFFISRQIFHKVEFDETYKLFEDYPFALNVNKSGFLFRFFDAITVFYRVSRSSVWASGEKGVLFNKFYRIQRPFSLDYIYPHISKVERFIFETEYYRKRSIESLGLNRLNWFARLVNSVTMRVTPYFWYKRRKAKEFTKKKR